MTNPDTNPFASALSGFFFAGDKNDPRVNPQLRQRLALAMLARDRKYPKNLGEGIASIGNSFADAMMQRQLEQSDIAQQEQAAKLLGSPGAAPVQAASLAPSDSVTSQPQVIPPPAPPQAPPQAPGQGQGFTPTPMQPGAGEIIDPGEYNALDANIDPRFGRRRAISGIESGGAKDPYSLLGAQTRTGDRAYGKYQVMGANVPSWTQEALGKSLTPQQFLTDKNAQDTVFDKKFGGYADKYGDQGAAKAWYAGEGGMNNPNATDMHGRLTVRGYGQDFLNRLNGDQPAGPRDAVATALLAQQQPQSSGRPSVADYGQPQALAATPPDSLPPEISTGASAISAAPPQPSGIRAAPQQQVAQAQPQAIPGYVPPEAAGQRAAPIVKMDPELLRLRAIAATAEVQNNGYAQALLKAKMDPLEAEHAIKQNAANELYKSQLLQDAEQNKLHQQARMSQYEKQQAAQKTQQELISGGGGVAPAATDPRILGTPQSPQRTGIPVAPPVPPGITPKEWSEKQTPELVKAVSAVEKATPQFKQMMDLLQKAEDHPGKEWGVGPLSAVTGHLPSAQGFKKIMEQIGGQNFLNAYQTLKGGGSITEIEGSKAEAAQARLSTAQTKDDFNNAMQDFKNSIRENLETVQRKVNQPVTAWQKTPNDEPAPDIGQLGTWKGKVREYIGGNPKLDSSYRDPR